MFWETKDPPSFNIEILLESPDTKVELFLEEDNIIQECKTYKKNIVKYFTRPDVIRRMIELITTEPPEETPLNERFRHANVACEILTLGLPSLDKILLAETDTLNMLYSYLENEPPLNPLLASFFSKTFSMLFTKKPDQDWFLYQQTCLQLLEYIKTKSNFLDLICKHFATPIIPDLVKEMMQNVEGVNLRKSLYEWLNEERLVEKLIEIIGDAEQSDKHANVADFLCDLIHQGRGAEQDVVDSFEPTFGDPILKKIESAATLLALFNMILQPNNVEGSIVSGVTVVLKIIEPAKAIDERNVMQSASYFQTPEKGIQDEFLSTVIRVIEPQIKSFNELLKNPPKKSDIITSAATLSPPFGMARLQIVRLFAALLETKNEEISKAICETDFLDNLLALFKKYCWNNFLHTEVEKCLHSIFPYSNEPPQDKTGNNAAQTSIVAEQSNKEAKSSVDNTLVQCDAGNLDLFGLPNKESTSAPASNPSDIQVHAIVNCQIISKLIECWKMNKEIESAKEGRRLGFMGHLINIFKHITKSISESEHIGALIENNLKDDAERDLWQSIVNETDGELTMALSTQSKLLANYQPCDYNISLDFFNDNMSVAFNDMCTLMDSSDADVIFTLDYNTQHDDNDFDDDDGDEDFNNINNDNNEGRDKYQRNDDVKNALNLFQFGRSNDDDVCDVSKIYGDDDNLAVLREMIKPTPFGPEAFQFLENLVVDFSTSTIPKQETNAASADTSAEEYDNNANVEKSSSACSGDFTSFQIPQKDTEAIGNFFDDYEDDEGMWTKPLGASAISTTSQLFGPEAFGSLAQTDDFKANFLTNGPCLFEGSEYVPEKSSETQLNNSFEDNTFVEQTTEDMTTSENKDELIMETNNEETTFKHKSNTPDTNNTEITTTQNTNSNPTTNTPTIQLTDTATTAEEIPDVSTTSTTTT